MRKVRQAQLFTGAVDVLGNMRVYVNDGWCHMVELINRVTNLEAEVATTVGEPHDFVTDFETSLDMEDNP